MQSVCVTPHIAVLQGAAVYAPEKEAMVWKIKNFPGGKEFLLRCKFGLPSVEAEEETKGRMPPIRVKFEIPYFTVSGIQVGAVPGQCRANAGPTHSASMAIPIPPQCWPSLSKDVIAGPRAFATAQAPSDYQMLLRIPGVIYLSEFSGYTPEVSCLIWHGLPMILVIAAGTISQGHREEWLSGATLGSLHHDWWRVRDQNGVTSTPCSIIILSHACMVLQHRLYEVMSLGYL